MIERDMHRVLATKEKQRKKKTNISAHMLDAYTRKDSPIIFHFNVIAKQKIKCEKMK